MWGGPSIRFVNGLVVGPDHRIFESILIKGPRVAAVGGEPHQGDVLIDLDGAVVFPGLINAHDHLELNSLGRLKWRAHHVNVREWIADFQPRFATDPRLALARPDTLADRSWVGGLKNLLSGVTTVCHHNPIHRVLRSRFPVHVVRRFGMSHSLQIDGDDVRQAYLRTAPEWPWIIHAAEGVDEDARGEIGRLDALGCLGRNTVLVHGVALDPDTTARVLACGSALIWCPSSNDFLFGRTADVRPFAEARRLAIGSDSRLSGQGDILDELRAARETGQVSGEALCRAVTTDAAAVLRLGGHAARLEPGAPADLTVIARGAADPFDALLQARRSDVRLTMIGGRPYIGDERLGPVFTALHEPAVQACVDGSERLIARWIARRTTRRSLREPGLEIAD